MVIWLIGLAGAGKTSIARAMHGLMKDEGRPVVLVDGDLFREVMGGQLGYTLEDRRENGWRICRLCRYLEAQDLDVVCATLSQFHEQQDWNRANLKRYFEVFIDVPMDVLHARDQKGLYSGARAGTVQNVVGVDMPFPPPVAPDVVLNNASIVADFRPLAASLIAAAKQKFQDT